MNKIETTGTVSAADCNWYKLGIPIEQCETHTIKPPVYSKWKCYLNGDTTHGTIIFPLEGQEPCWFHRKMQELILGFRWRKEKE